MPVIWERTAVVLIGSTAPIASMTSGTTLRFTWPTITGAGPPAPFLPPPFPPPPPPPAAGPFSPQPDKANDKTKTGTQTIWPRGRRRNDIMDSGIWRVIIGRPKTLRLE